ncbi:MAG: hypothetical protein M1829_006472 [Trizodia sp. TS-e1964]|nr:MAG: hypothetical protein M1829_006472 [Trizodia sp. TS-e1964]
MGHNNSIIKLCTDMGYYEPKSNCTIEFVPSHISVGSGIEPSVAKFGVVAPGEFETNPDIAGQGISFFVPSIIVCGTGLFLTLSWIISFCTTPGRRQGRTGYGLQYVWEVEEITNRLTHAYITSPEFINSVKRSNFWHRLLDEVMVSSADAQLFLILAFGTAFYRTAQCDISLYHYLLLDHMVVSGLATSALAYMLSHSFHRMSLTLILRTAVFILCAIGLHLVDYSNDFNFDANFNLVKSIPATNQIDSVILLPAYCLLDKSINVTNSLNLDELHALLPRGTDRLYPQQLPIVGIGGFIINLVIVLLRALSPNFESSRNKKEYNSSVGKRRSNIIQAFCAFSWVVSTAIIALNWTCIFILRNWVDGS